MKILWVHRTPGIYMIPVFAKLLELTNGSFHMLYSQSAVKKELHECMKLALRENAIAMQNEKKIIIGSTKSNFANTFVRIPYQKGLLKAIDKINPDVIIADGFFQWAFAALLRSKGRKVCIFYERTAHTERNAPKWRVWYRKLAGKLVDGFIINGSETRKYLESTGFGNYPKIEGCMVADVTMLQNKVQTCPIEIKEEIKKKYCPSSKGLLYIFIGQIVERKGVKQLLEAWELHSLTYTDDALLILGEGVQREDLEQKYGHCNSIHFLGGVPYQDMFKYYASCDVVLMPTLEDNWSLVVPEAMACSLPVATTIYNGNHKELIKDGVNGYAFDALNKEDFVETLSKFHKVDLTSFGQESYKIIQDYTPEIAGEKIYKFCSELIKNS